MTHEHHDLPPDFQGLAIIPKLLESLEHIHFKVPTPIQHKCIPVAIDGKDVIGIAQTGTGKTLAFGIPMIQLLAKHKGRGLVLLPTRELALQVDESLLKIGKRLGLRTAVLIGGENINRQNAVLKQKPHILIATPGRLIDHLQQGSVKLHDVKILVLDEADRMLDMGFLPQINQILRAVPSDRQTMLFSATMPNDIVRIASNHMKMPVRVEVAPSGTAPEIVEQELFIVSRESKPDLLEILLKKYKRTALVFTRTKHGASRLCRTLGKKGVRAAEIHSNRSLPQRIEALNGFKTGKYRVLVATDIAARGIDVTGIELVVNFDLPENADDYIHRIGRTGRAGTPGHAVAFATPDQASEIRAIEKLMGRALPIAQVEGMLSLQLDPGSMLKAGASKGRRPFGGRGGGRGGFGGRSGGGGGRGGMGGARRPFGGGGGSRRRR
jgi:ATP-dependent RNA helicase RhlE